VKLEKLRSDFQLATSDTLQQIDYADNKHIKKLYNYQLTSMREKDEHEADALAEYKHYQMHVDSFTEVIRRQQESKLKFG